jgi:hypothetical protein
MENAVEESQPLFVSRARTDLVAASSVELAGQGRRGGLGTRTGKLARECDLWDCYRERTNDDQSTLRGPPGSDDYALASPAQSFERATDFWAKHQPARFFSRQPPVVGSIHTVGLNTTTRGLASAREDMTQRLQAQGND